MKVKVTEKTDGLVHIDAVASAVEASRALDHGKLSFAVTASIRPKEDESLDAAALRQLGIRDLDAMAQTEALSYLIPFALDRANVAPLLRPGAHSDASIKRGRAFSFSFDVEPKPEIPLSSYDPVSIRVPAFKERAGEADEEIDRLMERFMDFAPAKARPI